MQCGAKPTTSRHRPSKGLYHTQPRPIIDRVKVIDIEKLRLVMPMVASLLILGNMSIRISSTVERQESPRNVTEARHAHGGQPPNTGEHVHEDLQHC